MEFNYVGSIRQEAFCLFRWCPGWILSSKHMWYSRCLANNWGIQVLATQNGSAYKQLWWQGVNLGKYPLAETFGEGVVCQKGQIWFPMKTSLSMPNRQKRSMVIDCALRWWGWLMLLWLWVPDESWRNQGLNRIRELASCNPLGCALWNKPSNVLSREAYRDAEYLASV